MCARAGLKGVPRDSVGILSWLPVPCKSQVPSCDSNLPAMYCYTSAPTTPAHFILSKCKLVSLQGWTQTHAFSQEISHRSLAGYLAVQAETSLLPRAADLAKHHSISWQWNGMGPVFPPSLVMLSGSGDTDGGKQLLTGPQRHLPKAWEGNVATVKVKKLWTAKPEHPYLVLKPWHCLATSSSVEKSRGEKGKALERLAKYLSPGV